MEDLSANFQLGSSIPLPAELASQLVAQHQADGGPATSNETTYFIPLQSGSSGQSFGVAVKLGTEGPPGPDQKVIMKAKLVTHPTGTPLGARVIGVNKPEKAEKGRKKTRVITSPTTSSSSDSSDSSDAAAEEKRVKPKKAKKPRLISPTPSAAATTGGGRGKKNHIIPVTSDMHWHR
jgi:hypothetical protein